MSPVRRAAPALDELIAEITADCNDEDEVLMGFEGFFDEQAHFPCPGTILGENINVISVAVDDDRRELVATCQRTVAATRSRCSTSTSRPTHRPHVSSPRTGGGSVPEGLTQ
jgi:hypothetical protein